MHVHILHFNASLMMIRYTTWKHGYSIPKFEIFYFKSTERAVLISNFNTLWQIFLGLLVTEIPISEVRKGISWVQYKVVLTDC